MNLNQLHYFVTLAHMEHFTKAAEELDITQPSLSHAMTTLEQELGTKLFQKQGRGVSLTKYGQIFLKYAEESLRILDMGVRKTKEMTGQTGGVIDLAYIYTLGSEFVPRLVGDFLRAHEELSIRFHFTVGNTSEILAGLKDEKYDVAFCSMAEKEPQIEFTPIATERLVLVVPKGHPLSQQKNGVSPGGGQLLIPRSFSPKSSGLRPVIDHLFEQAKIRPRIALRNRRKTASMAGADRPELRHRNHAGYPRSPDLKCGYPSIEPAKTPALCLHGSVQKSLSPGQLWINL